jgi:hypothetical protein
MPRANDKRARNDAARQEPAEALAFGLLSTTFARDPNTATGWLMPRLYLDFAFEVRAMREDDLPLTIDAARRGYEHYHKLLCELAADLTSRGKPLPVPLQEYMTVDAPAFSLKQGHPRGGKNMFRDAAIAAAVQAVVEQGFNRTRRRRGTNASACSIVAEVLRKEFRFNITEAGVEKLCERFRDTTAVLLPYWEDEEGPPPLPPRKIGPGAI